MNEGGNFGPAGVDKHREGHQTSDIFHLEAGAEGSNGGHLPGEDSLIARAMMRQHGGSPPGGRRRGRDCRA